MVDAHYVHIMHIRKIRLDFKHSIGWGFDKIITLIFF
jgi:hypothetical protein